MRSALGYVRSRLSLVVLVVDGYTRRPPKAVQPLLALEGSSVKPYRKGDAYYYMDLPPQRYKLQVSAEGYWEEEREVDVARLNPVDPVVYVWLKPKPSYSADSLAFTLRSAVRDSAGARLEGALAEAIVLSTDGIRARLGEAVQSGERQASLAGASHSIENGETLVLFEGDPDGAEPVTLVSQASASSWYDLQAPLIRSYPPGTKLHAYTHAPTDPSGEFALYLFNPKARKLLVHVRIRYRKRLFHKEVTLEQGKPLLLDPIIV